MLTPPSLVKIQAKERRWSVLTGMHIQFAIHSMRKRLMLLLLLLVMRRIIFLPMLLPVMALLRMLLMMLLPLITLVSMLLLIIFLQVDDHFQPTGTTSARAFLANEEEGTVCHMQTCSRWMLQCALHPESCRLLRLSFYQRPVAMNNFLRPGWGSGAVR